MNQGYEVDFTLQPYARWIEFLFEHDPETDYEPIVYRPSQPLVLIEYLTLLCGDLARLVRCHSWGQINCGLWAALMDPFWISEKLEDHKLPLETRIACIRGMKRIFSDVVAKIPDETPMENIFFMWWDIIAKSCAKGDLHDVVFEALTGVLGIKNERCQMCALHGLGHISHPQAPGVVQRYLDRHRKKLDAEMIQWIEECRDGTVM